MLEFYPIGNGKWFELIYAHGKFCAGRTRSEAEMFADIEWAFAAAEHLMDGMLKETNDGETKR